MISWDELSKAVLKLGTDFSSKDNKAPLTSSALFLKISSASSLNSSIITSGIELFITTPVINPNKKYKSFCHIKLPFQNIN